MVTFSTHAPGTPCWVDLSSPDVEASKAFYTAVFGWDVEDQFYKDQLIYTMCTKAGRSVVGIGGQPPGMEGLPPIWNTYIATDDAEAVVSRVTSAGGTVTMPPMQVMEAGEMAMFRDPTGAAFGVWKAGEHIGAGIGNEPDTFAWNELLDRDVAAAKTFYSSVFGWTYDEMDMGPMGSYAVIAGGENGGQGGLMTMPAQLPPMVPNHWVVYFMVADIEATITKVTGAGGQVVAPPMPVPGIGTIAQLHDATGGSFAILQPASAD